MSNKLINIYPLTLERKDCVEKVEKMYEEADFSVVYGAFSILILSKVRFSSEV